MKILITGSEGFIGQATIEYLKEKGFKKDQVIGYDIMSGRDILDLEQLCQVIEQEKPDRILHLAAIARFDEADKYPLLAHKTNVLGTMNIVEAAKKYHVPLVFSSTGSVYMPIKDKPPITEEFPIMGNSIYGCTKAIGDLYVAEHTPHIILRYAHIYGKEKRYHGLIGGFLSRIEHDLEPILYGGKQSNDFCYVKDIAQANYLALTAPWDKWNQAYNIGTGEELTAQEAGRIICQQANYKGEVQIKPQRTVDPQRFYYDITNARNMLGYKPQYSFESGLKDMFGQIKK